MKKRHVKKHLKVFAFILVVGGCLRIGITSIYNDYLDNLDTELVESFFQSYDSYNEISSTSNEETYLGVLEIPKINLKKGFYDKSSSLNTVSKNIEVLSSSDLPDVLNGNLTLASHSGNSRVSFFKDLDELVLDDLVYLYYDGIKYIYQITNIYTLEKNGYINVMKEKDTTTLTLTTCDEEDDTLQLVVVASLIEKENF